MAHNYHPACGCADCCDAELAEEARDEAIHAGTEALIKKAMRDHTAIRGCLLSASEDARESILTACEQFFVDVEVAEGDAANAYIAAAAVKLWRDLRPYVYAGLEDNAKDDATAAYDRAARNAA